MLDKKCTICKYKKSINAFGKSTRENDGYKAQCKDCRNKQSREHYISYYIKRKETINNNSDIQQRRAITGKLWRLKNKTKIQQSKKGSHLTEYRKSYMRKYNKDRRQVDTNYRLRRIWHKKIWDAINGICCSPNTQKILGTDIKGFRKYIESQFRDGMSWDNYGKKGIWEIDHIIPASYYDLTEPSKLALCYHYSNLQPLLIKENKEKFVFNRIK